MDSPNGPGSLGSIEFVTGALAGSSFQINKPIIKIGREPDNDIVVPDPSVSRHHAQITQNHGIWTISNLSDNNSLGVNKSNVPPSQQLAIHDRETITLGKGTAFLFQVNARAFNAPNIPSPRAQPALQQPPAVHQQPLQASPPPPLAAPAVAQQPEPPQYNPPVATPPAIQEQRQNQPVLFGAQRSPAGMPDISIIRTADIVYGTLEVSSNTHLDKPSYKLTRPVINIGRHPDNDIVINESVVSGYHAQIIRNGEELILIHPHPKQPRTLNGLMYRGRSIPGNEQFHKKLEQGDIFRIGDEGGTLVTLAYHDGSTEPQEIVPKIQTIALGAPQITIGRYPDNRIVLNDPKVSGHHAQLQRVQGGHRIVDMGSTHGVYVNGQYIHNQVLKSGDEVRIGPFKFTYTGEELTQQEVINSIRIDALNLKKVGSKQTTLIHDISIAIPPHKFVTIVGGSGAGKSTLMDALNGLRPAQEGKVLYDGQDYYQHLAAFSTQIGYVPQDDIIHRDLTVGRALYYAAKMRLSSDISRAEIKQRINDVLEDVDMTHRRGSLVSKLSGGQRKRVSIALELLANPSIFFLDEPTSGLDPGLDRKMMLLLRKLADKGHTIILVTHATNNINSCDYICFLAQGGRLAYFGPPDEAKTYFGKTDFAEIYSALEPTERNMNIPAEAEARFGASSYYQKYVRAALEQGPARQGDVVDAAAEVQQPKRGNPLKQFTLLSLRYLELLKNDTGNLLILLLQAPIIALILFFLAAPGVFSSSNVATCPPQNGIPNTVGNKFDCQNVVNAINGPGGPALLRAKHVTAAQALQNSISQGSGGDAQKVLFIMAFAAVMFGCINGAREIVKEEPIYRRERTVNLGIAPYMFSKVVVLGVLCLLQSAVLVAVVSLKAPFVHGTFLPPFLEIYITMALTSIAGLMIGLAISALSPNNDRATSFIPIILIPQVIFSGIIFPLDNPFLQFLGSFFAARWSMAAMGSSVGLHGDKLGSGKDFAYQGTLFTAIHPSSVQGSATFHLILMWLALVVMIVILGVATAYFLKRKDVRA